MEANSNIVEKRGYHSNFYFNISKIMKITEYRVMNILCFAIIAFFLTSCNNEDEKKLENNFRKILVEQRIGNSNYYISIPFNYSLHPEKGEDFIVYHISITDSSERENFSGGIFFGAKANEFRMNKKDCESEKQKETVLGTESYWTIYNCKSNYVMQTILKLSNDYSIHLWGAANNRTELKKMMIIFSTLYEKSN